MTIEEIQEKVKGFLVDEFEVEPQVIEPEAPMKETLNLDSLDYVDLIVVIESTFGFKVSGEDFNHIGTFRDFYSYIQKNVEKAS